MTILRRLISGGQPNETEVIRLTPESAARLRLPFVARLTTEHLVRQAEIYPDLAFTVRDTSHYAFGGLWRRRDDIGEIVEISRGPSRRALLQRLLGAFEERGVRLVVLDFEESASGSGFYADEGFSTIDRIVEYNRRGGEIHRPEHVAPVRRYRPDDFDAILEIDRESFPWLWWNSPAELDFYSAMPDVEIFVSLDGDRPVGYAGLTVRGAFAHLDRLAVRETYQRHGHGGTLLTPVLEYLAGRGIQRVSLSTQEDNYRSQSLYERYNFSRGRWTYEIRGLWLREPPAS